MGNARSAHGRTWVNGCLGLVIPREADLARVLMTRSDMDNKQSFNTVFGMMHIRAFGRHSPTEGGFGGTAGDGDGFGSFGVWYCKRARSDKPVLPAKLAASARNSIRNPVLHVAQQGDEEECAMLWQLAVGQKNRKAQQALCQKLLPLFERVAGRLSRSFRRVNVHTVGQEKADLVQGIVCAFLADLAQEQGVVSRWDKTRGSLCSWLYPFALCRGLDHIRKRRRGFRECSVDFAQELNAGLRDRPCLEHASQPLAAVEDRDFLRKFCKRILSAKGMGEQTLRLLEVMFWEERDREDVAKEMGIRRNTLDVRVKRLRNELVALRNGLI